MSELDDESELDVVDVDESELEPEELSDESELDSELDSFFFFLSVDFFVIDFFHLFNSASIFSRKLN